MPPRSSPAQGSPFGPLARLFTRAPESGVVDATLLYVKVFGLATLADRFAPALVFASLQTLAGQAAALAKTCGGAVIPGFGGGFLCVFQGPGPSGSPADNAAMFAIRLQQANVQRLASLGGTEQPPFGLQIGMGTGLVQKGTIFPGASTPAAYLGPAFEMAMSLAEECDVHSLAICTMTRNRFKRFNPPAASLKAKKYQGRGLAHGQDVYHYDPLEGHAPLRLAATKMMAACAALQRKEQRWPIHHPQDIIIATPHGHGTIVDVSLSGMGILLPAQVPVGATLAVSVMPVDATLRERLAAQSIVHLKAAVRFVKPKGAQFMTGLSYEALSESQKGALLGTLLGSQGGGQAANGAG